MRGLMARSVLRQNTTVPGGTWHNSSSHPEWQWKGDTSSDEVAGHMFAYPIIADLVNDGKTAAIELVDDIVGALLCMLWRLSSCGWIEGGLLTLVCYGGLVAVAGL